MSDRPTFRRRIGRRILPLASTVAALAVALVWLESSHAHQEQLNAHLLSAVQIGTPEQVRSLLDQGADPNARDTSRGEPLDVWSWLQRTLRTRGRADTAKGHPTLCLAVRNKHRRAEITRLLVERGANVNARDVGGTTALFWTARLGDLPTVEFLLSRGADVDARVSIGYTPLVGAVYAGEPRIVKLLLDRGGNVNVRVPMVGSLLRAALDRGPGARAQEIVRLLKQAGAKP